MNIPKIYILKWSNSDLIIEGPKNIQLEKLLSFTKKELVFNYRTYSRDVKRENVKIFNILEEKNNICTYQTYQGLIDEVKALLENKQKNIVQIIDERIPFPQPKLENMHGFRFNQREKTEELLKKNRSGLFEAPTRYGKSVIITNIINAFPGVKTVVIAPGVDLLPQLVDTIKKYCPERDVVGIYTGSKVKYMSDDITVCSMDSLHKLDKDSVKLLLIDEPHAAVSESRSTQLCEFNNARIYGFGATLSGRWSGNDKEIIGLIGPVLCKTTFTEAVELGALCPIDVKMIKVPFTPGFYKNRNTAYKHIVFENKKFLELVGKICKTIIPEDWQTLCFINNEKEAIELQKNIDASVIAMDKRFKNKKERSEFFSLLKSGDVKRCICSSIYSTGVTIDNIRCIINCDSGAGSILSIQKPGRLAEIKPNKKAGYMIDFIFEPTKDCNGYADKLINSDCWGRFKTYKEKGYNIEIYDLDSINNIKLI